MNEVISAHDAQEIVKNKARLIIQSSITYEKEIGRILDFMGNIVINAFNDTVKIAAERIEFENIEFSMSLTMNTHEGRYFWLYGSDATLKQYFGDNISAAKTHLLGFTYVDFIEKLKAQKYTIVSSSLKKSTITVVFSFMENK